MPVLISDGAMKIIIAYFSISILLIIYTIFSMWKTPALTFMKAMLTGNSIVMNMSRSRFFQFRVGSRAKYGTIYLKKIGPVFLSKDSFLIEKGSKTPVYLTFAEWGATIPPEWPALLQKIRESGQSIKNFDEYEEFIKRNDKDLSIPYYKTFKPNDLDNTFPQDINSSFIDSVIEYEKRSTGRFNQNVLAWVFVAAFFLVCAAIAFYILVRAIPPDQAATAAVAVAQNASSIVI